MQANHCVSTLFPLNTRMLVLLLSRTIGFNNKNKFSSNKIVGFSEIKLVFKSHILFSMARHYDYDGLVWSETKEMHACTTLVHESSSPIPALMTCTE